MRGIERTVTVLLLVLAALVAVAAVYVARKIPDVPDQRRSRAGTPSMPSPPSIPSEIWGVIRPTPGSGVLAPGNPASQRFRLAGTFFLYSEAIEGTPETRRAILDDLSQSRQLVVREGDRIDDFDVMRVFPDRIALRLNGVEYLLSLSFGTTVAPTSTTQIASAGTGEGLSMEDQPAIETSRFGKRVGENRWVFQRDELLRYYREVLDEPERIAALYQSLEPDYAEDKIAGYRLRKQGEPDFFSAVGLQEGDVVRRVNSMRMVSQRRAEYFLSEFLKDRVSALVFDIERGGKEEKLIYLIR